MYISHSTRRQVAATLLDLVLVAYITQREGVPRIIACVSLHGLQISRDLPGPLHGFAVAGRAGQGVLLGSAAGEAECMEILDTPVLQVQHRRLFCAL
ncbi:MAG TPA: hypothetical protein VNT01_03170 [Symbiobacteriaceae bacterium]|nr:hypothetical protein [Symbiobacteriaceae bacterium]